MERYDFFARPLARKWEWEGGRERKIERREKRERVRVREREKESERIAGRESFCLSATVISIEVNLN